jgi:Phytanoyl-CoA dioxygenase (PhyH)
MMKPFREIHANDLQFYPLHEELKSSGYLLVRELIPRGDVDRVYVDMVRVIDAGGWLLPGQSPLDCVANPEAACIDGKPAFREVGDQVFKLESLHRFMHHPAVRRLMELVVGPRVLVHPKAVLRLIFPNCPGAHYHAHQDHQGVGGDPEMFTAWTPFHDCPVELGALQVMEASHHFGLQRGPAPGHVARETALGGDWVGGQINAGDVLVFHSLTVHEASPNVTDRLRLSIDFRFQDYARDLNPGNLVFPSGRTWESIYAGWRSDELQYYWRRLPLHLKPSASELAELAETADTPAMRTKYATILRLIEAQTAIDIGETVSSDSKSRW